MDALDVLFDDLGGTTIPLPDDLSSLHGGPLQLDQDVLYANFVSTVDGVAALPRSDRSSALISGGSEADRFMMALLRASADVVLVGAGTLRSHPTTTWTASGAYPPGAGAFAALRARLGHGGDPPAAIVTASGEIDLEHPGLRRGALVVTTSRVARERTFPGHLDVVDLGDRAPSDGRSIVEALRSRGFRRILTEGGPTLMGTLLEANMVDELFLTVSPIIGGRTEKEPRPGIVEGFEILPEAQLDLTLRSARRAGAYLLLRYVVGRTHALEGDPREGAD